MQKQTIIENSQKKPIALQFSKIWEYRTLIWVFMVRDIKVQYVQTKLGIIWSFVQAFMAALIVNFFFGTLLNVDTGDIPYIVFAFPGMIAWYYFSSIVTYSGTSLIQSQNIIKKIYFPKLILPIYKSLSSLIELIVWLLVYVLIIIYYNYPINIKILLLPFPIILNIFVGLSFSIWLAATTVKKRDVLFVIPFLVGFGVLITPVFFVDAMIPSEYLYWLNLNPMAGVIAFYRWCLLDVDFNLNYMLGLIPSVLLFITGIYYFRKVEAKMSDIL